MVFLWAFGPEVEDAMPRLRYLAFYLLSGLAASLAQIAAMPGSTVPNLGASGAIAGVMGAFLVTYPRDQIRMVLFFGWFARITFIPAALLIGSGFSFSSSARSAPWPTCRQVASLTWLTSAASFLGQLPHGSLRIRHAPKNGGFSCPLLDSALRVIGPNLSEA